MENPLLQQDSSRPHVARDSLNFFKKLTFNLMPWPATSPDLSPIERVWDMLGRVLRNLGNPPQTLEVLRHEFQVSWDTIPQGGINHLLDPMPRRIRECVDNRGDPTH